MAQTSRQKLASVPPTSRAEREPHMAETAHKTVVNNAASISEIYRPLGLSGKHQYWLAVVGATPLFQRRHGEPDCSIKTWWLYREPG